MAVKDAVGYLERDDSIQQISINPALLICAGCNENISERYLLNALNEYWHENCLLCDVCQTPFINDGNTFYYCSGRKLCTLDYTKDYGKSGICSMCERNIQPNEFILKFRRDLYYHVECFYCCVCGGSFCVGDEFKMSNEKEIYCMKDYKKGNL